MGIEKALRLVKDLPRVALNNIKNSPMDQKKPHNLRRGWGKNKTHGRGHKGQGQRMTLPKLGFETGHKPFYLRVPQEYYYEGHHLKRQYPPLSLLRLQRMIDLGCLDPNEVIDISSICMTGHYHLHVDRRHYGINLTEEGAEKFSTPICIEVQWASEMTIATIERLGGVIMTRFYDPLSLIALQDPETYFKTGKPIPKCKLPPTDAVEYYSDPKFRGYLADPEKIAEERVALSQKYGYDLPDLSESNKLSLLLKRKDPRQIFFGLHPGWIVNLTEKKILKPKAEYLQEYYHS